MIIGPKNHAPVTLGTANGLTLTGQQLSLSTSASPTFADLNLTGYPTVQNANDLINNFEVLRFGVDVIGPINDGSPYGLYWSGPDVGANRLEFRTYGTGAGDGTGYNVWSSQFTSDNFIGGTFSGTTISGTTGTLSGGTLTLTNATSNSVQYGTNGVAAPASSSAGMKIKLWGANGGWAAGNYAIGIESGYMWLTSGTGYRFYSSSASPGVVFTILTTGAATATGSMTATQFFGSNSIRHFDVSSGVTVMDWNFQVGTTTNAQRDFRWGRETNTGTGALISTWYKGDNTSSAYMAYAHKTGVLSLTNGGASGALKIGAAITPDNTHVATFGNSTVDTYFQVGQGAANNLEIGWIYNATAGNAHGQIVTWGYNNPFKIDAGVIHLNTVSGNNIEFGGHFIPEVDNTVDVGSSSKAVRVVYAKTVKAPTHLVIPDGSAPGSPENGSHYFGFEGCTPTLYTYHEGGWYQIQ